ncbi:MAG: hypothetical protein MJB57_00630 [Gemmatimonadetes bacterium]|nr:hypothetical protein [Gemmatimonadota bacterium]
MSAPLERREELHFQGMACDACGQVFPKGALDEDRWCRDCAPRMRKRMAVWRHVVAALVVLPFGIWILRLDRLEFLPQAAWLLPLGAAYYLGFRIGREVVKGYSRWRRSR